MKEQFYKKNQKNPSILHLLKRNSSGFTLIECLLTLLITSLSLVVLTQTLNFYQSTESYFHASTDADFHRFLFRLDYELSGAYQIEIKNNVLYYHRSSSDQAPDIYRIEYHQGRHGGLIRIAPGHQPLLVNVTSFHIHSLDDYIEIQIAMDSGETYHAIKKTK